MKTNEHIPVWAWHGSIVLLGGAALMTLGLLAATLAGIADPRPLGSLTVEDTFADAGRWHLVPEQSGIASPTVIGGRYTISVSAGDGQLIGVLPTGIECPCTIELRALQISGSRDAGYGLWWGDTGRPRAVFFGINSDGYLGVLPGDHGSGAPVRDWQLFPHVHSLGQINVFRTDIDESQVTVRLNDEVAVQFNPGGQGRISAGFFVQASPHESAAFQFLSFKTWEIGPAHP